VRHSCKTACCEKLFRIVSFDAERSKLLEKANAWLKDNADVRVRNCETITWMSNDVQQLGDSEQMVLTKQLAEGKHTYYARGLRYDVPASTVS